MEKKRVLGRGEKDEEGGGEEAGGRAGRWWREG